MDLAMNDHVRTLKAKDRPSLASFVWEDPFLLDDQLTDEERMVRNTAQSYARRCSAPSR
jgi:glutaryl-CoA dehydrogenase